MSPKTRVAVYYGGLEYAIGGRSLDDVRAEVEAGSRSDAPRWLSAQIGAGRSSSVSLLLGAGIPIALGEVNMDGGEAPREHDPAPPTAA